MDEMSKAVESLDFVAQRAGEIAGGLSDAETRWKPSQDRFSVRETIWHLRDIDHEGFLPRLQRVLEEEHPFLPDVDGARLARERDYNGRQTAPAVDELLRGRRSA